MGEDKWVSEKGWFGHPRGLASSSGPLVSCRVCAACVQGEQAVKHVSFSPPLRTTIVMFIVSNAKPNVTADKSCFHFAISQKSLFLHESLTSLF